MLDKVQFRKDVLACKELRGTHVGLATFESADILSQAGYDFIWIDTEHTAIDYAMLSASICAAQGNGVPAIVRAHQHDLNHVKRILEMGPAGIIFPQIGTAEEAEDAMKSCLYPPLGCRGFGPKRASRYGFTSDADYIASATDSMARFIQIESEQCVKNLREIIRVPYIDGFIFGPCDLSGSIGLPGETHHPRNLALMREAISILKDAGKCIGISSGSCELEEQKFWHDLGINMLSTGGDVEYMVYMAKHQLSDLRKI